jgi:toxin FitB
LSFLLDANAVSEPKRQAPNDGFMDWLADSSETELSTSVLVVGELQRGVLKLPFGTRRSEIEAWIALVVVEFGDRILPIDVTIVRTWAEVAQRLRTAGAIIGSVDELIAATALARGLTLVTRNVRHFEPTGCRLVSPWSS